MGNYCFGMGNVEKMGQFIELPIADGMMKKSMGEWVKGECVVEAPAFFSTFMLHLFLYVAKRKYRASITQRMNVVCSLRERPLQHLCGLFRDWLRNEVLAVSLKNSLLEWTVATEAPLWMWQKLSIVDEGGCM